MNNISENISTIKGLLGRAELLVVTKSFPACDVRQALLAGVTDIAESRIQEAVTKFDELKNIETFKTVKKHFVGHLQTNKSKKAVELFDIIQSLDSLRLAAAIDRHARDIGKIQECLIEVKVSGEASKTGVMPENAVAFYNECGQFNNLKITGLMTIAPLTGTPEEARPYFKKAAALLNEIKAANPSFNILSMGMSGDYKIAIEEGSTMVRIGSAIFGERSYD